MTTDVVVPAEGSLKTRALFFLNEQHEPVTEKEIATALGVEKRLVNRAMRDAEFDGLAECVHRGSSTAKDPSRWVSTAAACP